MRFYFYVRYSVKLLFRKNVLYIMQESLKNCRQFIFKELKDIEIHLVFITFRKFFDSIFFLYLI